MAVRGKKMVFAKSGGSISDAPTDPKTGALSLTPKKLKMAIESGHADKQIDKKTGRIIYKRSPLKKSGPFEGLKREKQIRNKKAEGGGVDLRDKKYSSKMTKKGDILLQKRINLKPSQKRKFKTTPIGKRPLKPMPRKPLSQRKPTRIIKENRSMYGRGGGVCIRGMNKDAYGKNS